MPAAAPVFVVDDEEGVRMSLGRLLRAIGFESETFASAEDFLQAYSSERKGCLLVDIRMPGMSGLDLIEELQRRQAHIPAIVMTGHTDEASLERLATLNTIGFLEKPFTLADLRAVLAHWRPAER